MVKESIKSKSKKGSAIRPPFFIDSKRYTAVLGAVYLDKEN
jgi:hypothetical protein